MGWKAAAKAASFNAEQAKILDAIDAAEAAAGIERRISDDSGELGVWVQVEENGSSTSGAGAGGSP